MEFLAIFKHTHTHIQNIWIREYYKSVLDQKTIVYSTLSNIHFTIDSKVKINHALTHTHTHTYYLLEKGEMLKYT